MQAPPAQPANKQRAEREPNSLRRARGGSRGVRRRTPLLQRRGTLRDASLTLMAVLLPLAAAAHPQTGAQAFRGGTLDLVTSFGEDPAPDINVQIRGESPFDNVRLTLFGDFVLNRRFTVFNQMLIDPP